VASVAILARPSCILFLSPAHSMEILSKLAQFCDLSFPAREEPGSHGLCTLSSQRVEGTELREGSEWYRIGSLL
jgi:hypothetical protein